MARWTKQPNFAKLLEEYKDRTGFSTKDVAKAMGCSPDTIYSWKTRGHSMPPIEQLEKLAELLGCSITELVDDPGAPMPGATTEENDPKLRARMGVMFHMVKDVSDEEWEAMLKMIEAGRQIGRARKAKEKP